MLLNKIFTSHMVFPAKKPIRVYGSGRGQVEIKFAGQKIMHSSEADSWMVEFAPMEYGGPYCMEVVFEDSTVVLEDIYIGEVYLFAGQSNMQFKMKETNTPVELYSSNNKLRLFSTDRIENTDYYNANDGWVICDEEQVGNWSALAYLAGNDVSVSKDIAVGVIACYQGASVIESWVPELAFEKINISISDEGKCGDHYAEAYSKWNSDGILYKYALSQVIPYALSAVVWYQGESDTSEKEANVYCDELCELINIWRSDFRDENLPFVIIQIADYIPRTDIGWSLIQKAQEEVQFKLPFVKTVISRDVCENDDIHPKTKDKLAKRIADVLETI